MNEKNWRLIASEPWPRVVSEPLKALYSWETFGQRLYNAINCLTQHFQQLRYELLQSLLATSPNREIPATMVRPRDQNAPGKIGEARPAGNTHRKAAQRSTKDQVAWLYFRPIAWSRLGVESSELSEIAENREGFRVLPGLLSHEPLERKNGFENERRELGSNSFGTGVGNLPLAWTFYTACIRNFRYPVKSNKIASKRSSVIARYLRKDVIRNHHPW